MLTEVSPKYLDDFIFVSENKFNCTAISNTTAPHLL